MAKASNAQDPQPLEPAPQALRDSDPDWWSECTDGRCSETAALFAESQPAPLSVV